MRKFLQSFDQIGECLLNRGVRPLEYPLISVCLLERPLIRGVYLLERPLIRGVRLLGRPLIREITFKETITIIQEVHNTKFNLNAHYLSFGFLSWILHEFLSDCFDIIHKAISNSWFCVIQSCCNVQAMGEKRKKINMYLYLTMLCTGWCSSLNV